MHELGSTYGVFKVKKKKHESKNGKIWASVYASFISTPSTSHLFSLPGGDLFSLGRPLVGPSTSN